MSNFMTLFNTSHDSWGRFGLISTFCINVSLLNFVVQLFVLKYFKINCKNSKNHKSLSVVANGMKN